MVASAVDVIFAADDAKFRAGLFEYCAVLYDINPAAPTHIVLIPRGEPPGGPGGLEDGDAGWAGRMLVVAARIAAEQGLAEGGYRLVLNNGRDAGQEVPHIHMHILGGGPLGPTA